MNPRQRAAHDIIKQVEELSLLAADLTQPLSAGERYILAMLSYQTIISVLLLEQQEEYEAKGGHNPLDNTAIM